MFDIFTGPAKRVILVAESEAIALGHDFIGPEHLLLGLAEVTEGLGGQVLREHGIIPDEVRSQAVRLLAAAGITGDTDAAAEALASIGIDIQEIRRRADATFGPGEFQFPRPVFTPRAKTVLEQSLTEARSLGHDYVGTEHELLALLAEDDGAGLAGPGQAGGPGHAAGSGSAADARDIQILGAVGADPAVLRPAVLGRLAPQPS